MAYSVEQLDIERHGIAASVKRKDDRRLVAVYFVSAMLFGADLDRHFFCFRFYQAQPLRHSS